jgi:hypothetical protein
VVQHFAELEAHLPVHCPSVRGVPAEKLLHVRARRAKFQRVVDSGREENFYVEGFATAEHRSPCVPCVFWTIHRNGSIWSGTFMITLFSIRNIMNLLLGFFKAVSIQTRSVPCILGSKLLGALQFS